MWKDSMTVKDVNESKRKAGQSLMKCPSSFKCIFDIIQEVCTIYFSVAVPKVHEKGNKRKES